MIHLLLFGRQVYLKYSADEMSVYAAQASFFIIMAAFPFFMVLLALIQVAPMIHEADLLRFLLPAIPDRFRGLLIYLLDSLRSDSPAALISVTALAAIWSASKGMLGIEKGLNRVFGVTSPRNYILRRALCSVYTLCFSLMCVASLALLVFGNFLQGMLLKWIPALVYLSGTISLCRGLVMFFMLTIFFIALYTALPHRRLSIPGQIPGAMFSAAGWALTSLAFSLLPVFRLIRCHLRKSDRRDPFYAVALCLHLHSVCGGGDQLVSAVLQGKDPNFTEENCLGSYYKDLSFRPAGLRSNS